MSGRNVQLLTSSFHINDTKKNAEKAATACISRGKSLFSVQRNGGTCSQTTVVTEIDKERFYDTHLVIDETHQDVK